MTLSMQPLHHVIYNDEHYSDNLDIIGRDDPHNFVTILLHELIEQTLSQKERGTPPAIGEPDEPLDEIYERFEKYYHRDSPLSDLFETVLVVGEQQKEFQWHPTIQLDATQLGEWLTDDGATAFDLEQLIEAHFGGEEDLHTTVWKLPTILILYLSRVNDEDTHSLSSSRKDREPALLSAPVQIPEVLDLSRYEAVGSRSQHHKSEYRLLGYVCNKEAHATTSFVRNLWDGAWYYVSDLNIRQHMEYVTNSANIIFYERTPKIKRKS